MKHKIVLFLLFMMAVGLYVLTIKGVPGNPPVGMVKGTLDQATKPLELSPERGRYLLTKSLAEYGSFALNQEYADAAYPDVGYYEGRYYVYFAPGMSLFALPFYLVGDFFGSTMVGAFSVVIIFALLNLVLLYRLGRDIFKFSFTLSLLAPAIFGFASSSWAYAVTLYQHHTSTFFILSGVYAVWRYAQKGRHAAVWALYLWFAYALAILIDYPNALLLLPVMIYFFFSSFSLKQSAHSFTIYPRWVLLTTSVLFVLVMGWHGYFNYVHFGSPTRVSGSLVGYKHIIENNLQDLEKQVDIEKAAEEKNPIGFFSEYNFPFGLYTLTVSSDRGLFRYYPIYLVAVLGIISAVKKKTYIHLLLLSLVGVNVFLYASFGDPWGGWAFGSRYLIPSMAILSLYVVLWLSEVRYYSLTARTVVLLLFIYSAGIALVGALTSNGVPPQVEADTLGMPHNFILNFTYLFSNRSSSIFYNSFISSFFTLTSYFYSLLALVVGLFSTLLFVSRGDQYEK